MSRSRLFVARHGSITLVARKRPWPVGSRTVHRRHFATLVEKAPVGPRATAWSLGDAAVVFVPPLVVFLMVAAAAGLLLPAFGAACGVFFLMAYLHPIGARINVRGSSSRESADRRVLAQDVGREVFDRALESADRISETWPALGALVHPADAEAMLVEALWELAGVLREAEQLHTVLVELSRPEFAQRSADDETAREVERQRQATRRALVALNEDVARRVTGIRRAEEAGLAFIREQQMRQAIHAAEESLRRLREHDAAAAALPPGPDAAAELAEQTQSVLEAYRELTTRYRTDPHAPS